jgi:hypothetical protein
MNGYFGYGVRRQAKRDAAFHVGLADSSALRAGSLRH